MFKHGQLEFSILLILRHCWVAWKLLLASWDAAFTVNSTLGTLPGTPSMPCLIAWMLSMDFNGFPVFCCSVKWQKTRGKPFNSALFPLNSIEQVNEHPLKAIKHSSIPLARLVFSLSPSNGTHRSASVWPSSPFCGCHVWPTPKALRSVTTNLWGVH